MEQLNNDIQQLIGQAEKLAAKHSAALGEIVELRSKLDGLQSQLQEKEDQIVNLAEEAQLNRIASAASADEGDPEQQALKKEINKYIKQIDKCIALLKT